MPDVTKTIEINGKEYTLELSAPHGVGTPGNQGIEPYYQVVINNRYLGRIRRQNGFWYPLDSFCATRIKSEKGREMAGLIFEAADFQAMGEMIEGEV